jgi:hypothetical protein
MLPADSRLRTPSRTTAARKNSARRGPETRSTCGEGSLQEPWTKAGSRRRCLGKQLVCQQSGDKGVRCVRHGAISGWEGSGKTDAAWGPGVLCLDLRQVSPNSALGTENSQEGGYPLCHTVISGSGLGSGTMPTALRGHGFSWPRRRGHGTQEGGYPKF